MRISNLSINPILLVRYLLIFTTVILFILSAATFLRISPNSDMKVIYLIYGILMLGDGAAMLISGLWINKQQIYWFAVIVLSLNIILTIFDQFGMIDFLFVLLNVITLFSLLRYRKELLPQ
ncbi:MAG: hypothetical protein MUO77_21365 [Anaerolineales bacterium]|nr:hypothetical protein [Anaerolineales bacterium]